MGKMSRRTWAKHVPNKKKSTHGPVFVHFFDCGTVGIARNMSWRTAAANLARVTSAL